LPPAGARSRPAAPTGVSLAVFGPDGRYLLTVGSDNAVRVRNAMTGRPETPLLKHETTVTRTLFTPDASHILTVSGGTARLWPVVPPAPHQVTLPVPGGPSTDLSADGRRVLISLGRFRPEDRMAFEASVHDAATGQPITRER
jgi:WD40 repeat protein